MDDLISRQAAIRLITGYNGVMDKSVAKRLLIQMPSVQPESAELSGKVWDEWCTGCKEYDQERHCCPRFNRVIRTAIDDAQPEIVRCKDCKHYKTEFCAIDIWTADVKIYKAKPDDFCSRAERRQDAIN